jgi:hypothetical protein
MSYAGYQMPATPSTVVQHTQESQDVLFLTVVRFSHTITKNEQQISCAVHAAVCPEALLRGTIGLSKHCPELLACPSTALRGAAVSKSASGAGKTNLKHATA